MNSRKHTAWKKNRKFADVYGGRTRVKIPDRVWNRAHSLSKPTELDELPILLFDNPSRDFFFPLTEEEILHELSHLPNKHTNGLTHIWMRRINKREYQRGEIPFAEFICGSGVRLIVLYPWPTDMKLFMGKKKPSERLLRQYLKYGAELQEFDNGWSFVWDIHGLKNFYVEYLLFHEIGHHIDQYYRHWSKANLKQVEELADQYAYERTSKRCIYYCAKPE